jgi:hypothetical protein
MSRKMARTGELGWIVQSGLNAIGGSSPNRQPRFWRLSEAISPDGNYGLVTSRCLPPNRWPRSLC